MPPTSLDVFVNWRAPGIEHTWRAPHMCVASGPGEDVAALVSTECKEQSRRISLFGGRTFAKSRRGARTQFISNASSGRCEEASQTGVSGTTSLHEPRIPAIDCGAMAHCFAGRERCLQNDVDDERMPGVAAVTCADVIVVSARCPEARRCHAPSIES